MNAFTVLSSVPPVDWMDFLPGALLAPLGFAIGLWFTRVFWMDAITGQPTALWKRICAGILFILTGAVPGAVQTYFTPDKQGGIISMGGLVGFFGVGLIAGYFLPQRFVATDVFAGALSLRIRAGAGQPTPVEVFAFTTKFGSPKARAMLQLDEAGLDRLFSIGITQFRTVIARLDELQTAVVLDALCGVPVTQVARDYGQSTTQVIAILARAFP